MLNHGIRDLLSHYYFTHSILDFEIYRTALSVHHIDRIRSTRMTKQHERNHLSVLCDQLKTLSRVKVHFFTSQA